MTKLGPILKFAALGAAAIATLVLASCNTVAGMGRDVQNAGTTLENAGNN